MRTDRLGEKAPPTAPRNAITPPAIVTDLTEYLAMR